MSTPPWTLESRETLLETRIFSVEALRARSQLRPQHSGEFVAVRCVDWVNVIAQDDDGHVVFVEQYRHGTGAVTLEIPGGMVDPGEDFIAAGLRELLEETGYGGGTAELIGVVEPNPAFMTNRCGTVWVRGVKRVAEPDPDPNEELAVSTHSLAAVDHLIRSGRIQHALVVAAFHHLHLWRA